MTKGLSNKFWAVSFYSLNRLKNKAFALKLSMKAFVMPWIFSIFVLRINN